MKVTRHVLTASVMIATLLYAVTVFAQMDELRNTTPAQRAKLQTAFMKMKLNLAPEQMKVVMGINLKYAQKMDPILKGNEGKLRKAAQARAIDEAKDNELQGVLSGEQYQAYMTSKEEMRRRMVEKLKNKRAGNG
jgi:hypothetical protein